VEAQHIVSTLRLVSNAGEQALLERILERSKPPLPEGCADLHYLLVTPFRYSSPTGSRFRAAADGGVWYGAEKQRTACAELGFWRWRFLVESASLSALGPSPQTVFRAAINARWVDLTAAPFKRARADWTVRDPGHGAAVAVLNPRCFKPRTPLEQSTWFLTVRPDAAIWQREGETMEFDAAPWRASL
jgi:hypothetical protein